MSKSQQELAQEIVELIGDRVNNRGDLAEILELVKREIWRREDAKKASEWQGKIEQAKADYNLMAWREYAAKYGFHESEWRAALAVLPMKSVERGISFFVDQPPTDDQRKQIADDTTMSKRQACEYLGITPREFDKLKKAHGLKHASIFRAGQRTGNFPAVAYLYRKSDIDRLRGRT